MWWAGRGCCACPCRCAVRGRSDSGVKGGPQARCAALATATLEAGGAARYLTGAQPRGEAPAVVSRRDVRRWLVEQAAGRSAGVSRSSVGRGPQCAQRAQTHRGVRRFGHRVDTEHDLRRVKLQQPAGLGAGAAAFVFGGSAPASPSHTAIALCSSFATASPRPSCAGPRKCDPDNIPGPTRRRRHRWSNMRPGSRSGRLARRLTCRPPHPPARVPPVPARSGRARPVPGRRTPRRRAGRSCRGTRSNSAPVSARSSRAPCG